MESDLGPEMTEKTYEVTDRDPQKEAIYKNDLCGKVSGEVLSGEAARSVLKAVWESHIGLPVKEPNLAFNGDNHTYQAWKHEITLSCSESSVETSKLLHEVAHSKLGALGIGPFIETHGPLFLRVFGQMWSTYAAKPEEKFFGRCENLNLEVAPKLPNLNEYPWAVVEEDGMEYAVRPAQRAVEIGWNIVRTFNVGIAGNHPMGKNTDP